MPAVADSSALIWLAKAGRLDLLRDQYKKITIPREVYAEAVERGLADGHSDAHVIYEAIHQGWITVEDAPDGKKMKRLRENAKEIGAGEAAAMLLAMDTGCPLLIDDADARSLAQTLGLTTRGTIHTILTATHRGRLTKTQATQTITHIVDKGFRIDPTLLANILAEIERSPP